MKQVIFIPTAAVFNNQPSPWLQKRLDKALEYYLANKKDVAAIVISGRWENCTDEFEITEAQVAKDYLLDLSPNLPIFTEDFAVETGGNYAFSKPIIAKLSPKTVVIITSKVLKDRNQFFATKIWGSEWQYKFILINDELSANPRAMRKEPKALAMFEKIFADVKVGDAATAREYLLKRTPFYDKSVVADKDFFDAYWPGGFADFLEKRLSIENK